MADLVITEKEKLVEIANAIREKSGTSDAMAFPNGFLEVVNSIGGDSAITASGTLTVAENQASGVKVVVDTGVRVINSWSGYVSDNSIFCLWINSKSLVAGSYLFLFCQGISTTDSFSYGVTPNGDIYNVNAAVTYMVGDIKWNYGETVKLIINGSTTGKYAYGLIAGVEYCWAYIFKGELGT